jgi:hypothetical protein
MQMGQTSLLNLAKLGNGVRSKRASSWDTTGGNSDFWPIPAGKTVTLADLKGAGCVRHIWMTTRETDNNLRRLVVRMYWDGEQTPSVVCPLGDFFGLGHGKANYFNSMPLQTSHLGLNCWFPMPYVSGARVTVTNDTDLDSALYFYIDYQEWSEASKDLGRFHAHWRRQVVTTAKNPKRGPNALGKEDDLNLSDADNYLVLQTAGKGHYVGCCLHIDTRQTGWWGEGDDMFVIDDEPWPPRLHGTGTEDYFCGAWNYNLLNQTYSNPYYGYSFKTNADYTGKHSQYRFHVEDPIYFEKSLRFSIEHGHANDRAGDWTSTAYWYQINRMTPLPEIGSFQDRLPYAFGGLERWAGGKDRKELPE